MPVPEEYRARKRRLAMRARKLRQMGKPQKVFPHEYDEAMAVVQRCYNAGMTQAQMAEQCDVNKSTIAYFFNGSRETLLRSTYNKIMTLRIESGASRGRTAHSSVKVNPAGTQRRLQALTALGFSAPLIASYMDVSGTYVRWLTDTKPEYVYFSTRAAAELAYEKLQYARPEDFSIRPQHIRQAKAKAEAKGWGPPICWDPDVGPEDEGFTLAGAIDDPGGYPDWTGECGTVRGYFLHLKHDIRIRHYTEGSATGKDKQRREVLCQPCRTARTAACADGQRRSWVDEDAIRDAVARGGVYRDVAADYQCSTMTVQRIVNQMKSEGWVPPKSGPRPGKEY